MKNLRVIVVGAGIGGLQTALALATDGHQVTVLEAVKEFLEVYPSRLPCWIPSLILLVGRGRDSCAAQLFSIEYLLGRRFQQREETNLPRESVCGLEGQHSPRLSFRRRGE